MEIDFDSEFVFRCFALNYGLDHYWSGTFRSDWTHKIIKQKRNYFSAFCRSSQETFDGQI